MSEVTERGPDSDRGPGVSRQGLGSWLSATGSVLALVVSGVSLWETALKQPQLKLYVGETLSYTRDPWGSYEVFVVPVTITNSGARDGAVISMRLDLTNPATGDKETYESAYTADASWYSGADNVTNRTRRPKSPFSPLSIAGRSAWSGTILFYAADYKEKKLAEPRTALLTGSLSVTAPQPEGWLDRTFSRTLDKVALAFQVPNFLPGALLTGDVIRLRLMPQGVGGAAPSTSDTATAGTPATAPAK